MFYRAVCSIENGAMAVFKVFALFFKVLATAAKMP